MKTSGRRPGATASPPLCFSTSRSLPPGSRTHFSAVSRSKMEPEAEASHQRPMKRDWSDLMLVPAASSCRPGSWLPRSIRSWPSSRTSPMLPPGHSLGRARSGRIGVLVIAGLQQAAVRRRRFLPLVGCLAVIDHSSRAHLLELTNPPGVPSQSSSFLPSASPQSSGSRRQREARAGRHHKGPRLPPQPRHRPHLRRTPPIWVKIWF